jgi:hypothetical protein
MTSIDRIPALPGREGATMTSIDRIPALPGPGTRAAMPEPSSSGASSRPAWARTTPRSSGSSARSSPRSGATPTRSRWRANPFQVSSSGCGPVSAGGRSC